jgi:class 3 adenylate cyclase/Tfp pilus assembly protein PilF
MFTDMVGYSALSQQDEALALELLEEHRRIVRATLPRHGGREVKTIGDGFLLEFPSALAAVQGAVEIQQTLHERNVVSPPARRIDVRIGIHVCDVVERDGDIYGDGVNLGARLEPLATPGGICVSEDVARQVRNKLPNTLAALGPAELKNIELATVVHRVLMPWEPADIPAGRRRRWAGVAVALVVVCTGIWFALHASDKRRSTNVGVATAPASSAPSNFPRDPDLRRARDILAAYNTLPADLRLAEDIVKNAVARDPANPDAAVMSARVDVTFLYRGWDLSEERFVSAGQSTQRALQLAPDNPESLAAMGLFLTQRNADPARAEEMLRRAIALDPREPRYQRVLAYDVLQRTRPQDAEALAERLARDFPDDPLVFYELGLLYRRGGRIEKMDRAFDRALELAPFAATMIWKGYIAAWWRADVPGLKTWLDRVPANFRLNDRVVCARYEYAILANEPAEALQALRAFPGTKLTDFWYTGPKGLLVGDLLALQHRNDLARGEYEAALAQIAREAERTPRDYETILSEMRILLGLERTDEARGKGKLLLGMLRRPYRQNLEFWLSDPIRYFLLLDERETALSLMKESAASPTVRRQLRIALRLDPRMKRWAGRRGARGAAHGARLETRGRGRIIAGGDGTGGHYERTMIAVTRARRRSSAARATEARDGSPARCR